MYEYKEIGKRVSASPLFPRAVYRHPRGRWIGNPYTLRDLKIGSTLHFSTSNNSALPPSITRAPYVLLRVMGLNQDDVLSLMWVLRQIYLLINFYSNCSVSLALHWVWVWYCDKSDKGCDETCFSYDGCRVEERADRAELIKDFFTPEEIWRIRNLEHIQGFSLFYS